MLVDSLRLGFLDMDAAPNQLAAIEQRSASGVALRFIGKRTLEGPQRHLANRELQESNWTTAGKLNE
jgi:hypothetical protein